MKQAPKPAKPRFSRHAALIAADELRQILAPVCERVEIVGSLRRGKQWVGDVEILFIGKIITRPKAGDMFATETVSLATEAIASQVARGLLAKRPNALGGFCWGDANKLALHVLTGVPVDLFATTAENWHNALVVRTGSAAHNVQIAQRAKAMGWNWNAYGPGFTRDNDARVVTREEDLFEFLGMHFKAPPDR